VLPYKNDLRGSSLAKKSESIICDAAVCKREFMHEIDLKGKRKRNAKAIWNCAQCEFPIRFCPDFSRNTNQKQLRYCTQAPSPTAICAPERYL